MWQNINKTPLIFVIFMLLIATFIDLPYAYYILLRWFVFGVMCYVGSVGFEMRSTAIWACVVVGLIFNPFEPIHLDRSTWQLIDIVVATVFLVYLFSWWREAKQDIKGHNSK